MCQMILSQFWILKCVLRFLRLCIPPIDTLKAFHLKVMKEMMEVKGEGRLDKVTEKKLRIYRKQRKKEREKGRKRERKKERKKKTERKRGEQEEWIDYTIEG